MLPFILAFGSIYSKSQIMQINHFYVTWVIGMNGIFYQSAAKKLKCEWIVMIGKDKKWIQKGDYARFLAMTPLCSGKLCVGGLGLLIIMYVLGYLLPYQIHSILLNVSFIALSYHKIDTI